MNSRMLGLFTATLLVAGIALADGTVTATLASPQNGQTVAGGSTVNWSVYVAVSTGDNAGLALFTADLVQDGANPAKFDLPPGDAGTIPTTINDHFNRPGGITNPGEGGNPSGYVGVQRGTTGEKNLKQICGAQNTFGEAGSSMGTNPSATGGIGQSGAQLMLSGSFTAPSTAGTYTFRLENGLANTIATLNTPPNHSPVTAATVDLSGASFTITVQPGYATGDLNCDGTVDLFDIDPFVLALTSASHTPAFDDYLAAFPSCDPMLADANGDLAVDLFDIDPFVAILTGP